MGSHISLSQYVVNFFIKFLEGLTDIIGRAYVGMRFTGHRRPWISEIVIRKHGCLRLAPHPLLT